jgi:predicted nucleic acid-binding protein
VRLAKTMCAELRAASADTPPCYVRDSFALLAHFQEERGNLRVLELLEEAQQGNCRLLLSLVNLGEVCYLVERRRGLPEVHRVLAAIDSLPIEIFPADRDSVLAAAHLKALYPIAFADAFAAAAAQSQAGVLLSGDPEFKTLVATIPIKWLQQ